jgi:peptidylprolyl isomerase
MKHEVFTIPSASKAMSKKLLFPLLALTFLCGSVFAQKKKDKKTKYELNKEYTTATGLKYTFLKLGTGAGIEKNDMVTVDYVGKFTNDTVFDSSYPRKAPYTFKIGYKQAIDGWDEAMQLMHVGDSAKLILPPSLGYGDKQVGMIPPNSTLVFIIKIVSMKEGAKPFDVTKKDTTKLPSGVKIVMITKGKGPKINDGDILTVKYSAYLPEGKCFDSSVERGDPIKYNMGKGLKGLDEGIKQMVKGGKARIIVPYALAFGEQGRQGLVPPKTDVIFDVELLDVRPKPVITAYETKGKDTVTTPSGLKYIIVAVGNGAKAESGKTVKVHYTGYLMDGKVFDSSIERDQPIEFPLGKGAVIRGWDEAISLMKVGDKLRIIIPPSLGYGDPGSPPVIPPKATLIFDVELIEVK